MSTTGDQQKRSVYDASCWPLGMTFSSGSPRLEDMLDDAANWRAWLGRGERFAILRVLLDRDAYAHPPGAAQARKAWLAEHGDLIRQHMLGMALVLPEDVLDQAQRMQAERLFGVPAQAFCSIEDAIAWLRPLMTQNFGIANSEAALIRALVRSQQMIASLSRR
ncbi:hypothetical protein [Alcaligenes faecalis]|uniref:hypothetical protein n=1 Tax=Alcaligenes faecalis TaxID=511 RepID=UPI000F0B59AA|nr:hypothetical protein [Alcaligenes faecalis]AYR19743.1 hypothetical protein D6I95_04835 [Alcaligenes faecalis]